MEKAGTKTRDIKFFSQKSCHKNMKALRSYGRTMEWISENGIAGAN